MSLLTHLATKVCGCPEMTGRTYYILTLLQGCTSLTTLCPKEPLIKSEVHWLRRTTK